jgi:Domain of unknown function (DUF4340)/Type II secretion system (T2SS), protein G
MNATVRTAIFAGIALVLVIVAVVTTPGIGSGPRYEDEGELFFPEFTEPGQAVALEVLAVDEKSATPIVFKVQRKDGIWTIPSQYDYPADAKERMADAASLLIGLTKGTVRSDARAEHAHFGVVDPRDQKSELEGRGLLVVFKDDDEQPLGELIIGNEVEGHSGMRFVRIPEKRRTYAAMIPSQLSTAFEDWVETDLLQLSSFDVEKLVFDNYSVDEEEGVVRPGEKVIVAKKDSAWTVEGQTEEEETDTDKLDEATRALDDMKIVGVLPKPEGLTDRLQTASGYDREILIRSLMGRGFFLGRDRLYSNEGDLLVTTKDGVLYTLAFGEILSGTGDKGDEEKTEGDETKKKDGRPNRYLMVTVGVSEERLAKPAGEEFPREDAAKRRNAMSDIRRIVEKVDGAKADTDALPETLAEVISDDTDLQKDPWENVYAYTKTEDGYRVVSLGRDGKAGGEGLDADIASDALETEEARLDASEAILAWAAKLEEAKKRVAELKTRFAPWYYVIDAELFDKLKLSRADAVKAKATEDGDGEDDKNPDDGAGPDDDE